MKYRALVTAEVIKPMLEKFSDKIEFVYDGYCLDHDVMPQNELSEKIGNYDILICEYDTIDANVLKNAGNLKIILCCRGNVKSVIDLEAAKEKGIVICNNSGRNANAVSDMTLGYILDLTRNISLTNELIHSRTITTDVNSKPDEYADTVWGLDKYSPFIRYRGKSVNYMTLGLVGFGCAGRLVAKKANVFGMNIVAFDPFVDPSTVPDYVKMVSFDELLSLSDIVSLHCVVTPETKKMFNKDAFKKMKKGSYFINTARGELVEEADMIEALNNEHLAGAAIDVTFVEPIASNSPLVDAKNLIITPHIAGSAYDVQVKGTEMLCDTLEDWLNGEATPRNCVVNK